MTDSRGTTPVATEEARAAAPRRQTPRGWRRFRRAWRELLAALAPPLLNALCRFVVWTMRVEYRSAESLRACGARGERVIVAFWHDRLLMMPLIGAGAPMCVMISASRDGEMATRLLSRWGVTTVRGSTSRGAVGGFFRLVDAYRRGNNLVVLPDGPRGPRHTAKAGVIHLAKALHAPIYPAAFAVTRPLRLKSWDRLIIPLPFGRMLIAVGERLDVPPKADAEALESCRAELERRLVAVTASVEAEMAPK